MRWQIFWLALFIGANFGLMLVHIQLFQSNWPFSAWASMALHAAGLLFFPYERIFTIPPIK